MSTTTEKAEFHKGDNARTFVRENDKSGWYTGVVTALDTEKGTVTLLMPDAEEYVLPESEVKEVNDVRMRNIRELPASEAALLREEYLKEYEAKVTARKEAEREARAEKREAEGKPASTGQRGRPKADHSDTIEAVFNLINDSKTYVTKTDISAAYPEMSVGTYNEVMKSLKDSKRIEQHGERRGARYGVPGKTYEEPAKTSTKKVVEVDTKTVGKVVTFITKAKEPVSRSQITEGCKITDEEWMAVRVAVVETGKVQVTGKKRGTRYSKV